MFPMKFFNKPAIVGGVLVLAMVIGGWLGNLFQGFGPGGDRDGGVRVPAPDADDPAERPVEPVEEPPPAPAESRPADVLEVMIVDESYALRQTIDGREELIPVELSQLLELARAAPGNQDGIRVRVYRHYTSRPPAEMALEQGLRDTGLDSHEVYQVPEVVR